MMTLGCADVFCPHGRLESPLNKLFTLGGRLFNPPKRKHSLKRAAESHRCEVNQVNTLGSFACNFSTFFKVLKGIHFRKLPTEFERSDRFWPQKFRDRIEHVGYLIRYCKISLLLYSGSTSFSNAGRFFFTHPVVR